MKKKYRKFKREQARKKGEKKKKEKDITAIASDVDVVIICDDDTINLIGHDCT